MNITFEPCEIAFEHTLETPDGMHDCDVTADVYLGERVAVVTSATIRATDKPSRLTPERRAKLQELALEYADEAHS